MDDRKGGDTDFRRSFNRADAAARGAERERKEREEGKARYEAKLEGKKYHRRASTPPDARETEARSSRLDVASMIGKTMLVSVHTSSFRAGTDEKQVPSSAGQGKRGKSAGFYCSDCDLTFKWVHDLLSSWISLTAFQR
jgi:U4/U6.U5 tri-snRNP component SNU23